MSDIHKQDIDGCEYTMSVIMQNDNRVVSWSHTEGEFDKYDMDLTCRSKFEGRPTFSAIDENKDRRWGWKTITDENGEEISVIDYDNPQFTTSFSSQMFNYEKYEPMMEIYENDRKMPVYTVGYQDGVWVCDIRTLPKDLIYKDIKDGGWKKKVWIKKKTMDGKSKKVLQDRFLIPNEYGKIILRNDKQGDNRPVPL